VGILLEQSLPKGYDIILLTSLETEVTQLFHLTYQLPPAALARSETSCLSADGTTHASLAITTGVSYMIKELLLTGMLFAYVSSWALHRIL